jgi:hypothetical protein
MVLDCHTILCVQNQIPDVGMGDLFIVGYLITGLTLLVYFMIDSWKEY